MLQQANPARETDRDKFNKTHGIAGEAVGCAVASRVGAEGAVLADAETRNIRILARLEAKPGVRMGLELGTSETQSGDSGN